MAAPRPYWKGYLKLSLVSCPIALYTAATATERVRIDNETINERIVGSNPFYIVIEGEPGTMKRWEVLKLIKENFGFERAACFRCDAQGRITGKPVLLEADDGSRRQHRHDLAAGGIGKGEECGAQRIHV